MCYPTPGPRCSNHAYKEYVEAQQKYAKAKNADQKLILGNKMNEKEEAYYATPRGLNLLRRQIDSSEGMERDKYIFLRNRGEALRAQQLKDYANTVANQSSNLEEKTQIHDVRFGRYDKAVAIAGLFLANKYPEKEIHIESKDTIILDENKILVLPNKYQNKWGSASLKDNKFISPDDESLNEILSTYGSFVDSDNSPDSKISQWFISHLQNQGYTAFASVNTRTENVVILKLDKLADTYSISIKPVKRLGGTSPYSGTLEDIEKLLVGTPFANGKLLNITEPRKLVIYDVAPQSIKTGALSEDVFLGWHKPTQPGSGGYYEVRKRHNSNNYDVIIKLASMKAVFVTGVEDDLF
jgi:hypothetical protein